MGNISVPTFFNVCLQDDQVLGGCSGEFQGTKLFNCAPDHGLFFPVNLLKRDDRFEHGASFPLFRLPSDQSSYDALKELETVQPPSNPGSEY